jgi:phosphopantothenoylcysteine synthetase/decarboxylase
MAIAFFQKKLLQGKKVLITAGPTFEPIDPVRGITNRSSGKMGFAIAQPLLFLIQWSFLLLLPPWDSFYISLKR